MIGHDLKNMITAVAHDAVCRGSCVMLQDNQIIYAGPIKGSPEVDEETCILLHEQDAAQLTAFVEKNNEKSS